MICLWETKSGTRLHTLTSGECVVYSADGQLAYIQNQESKQVIHLWDIDTLRGLWFAVTEDEESILKIDFHPKNKQLLVFISKGKHGENSLLFYDLIGKKKIRTLDIPLSFHNAVLHPEGHQVALITSCNTLLYDLNQQHVIRTFRQLSGEFPSKNCLAYRPDSQQIASSCYRDQRLYLWNTAEVQPNFIVRKKTDDIRYLTYTPQEQLLLVTTNELKFLDPMTGKKIKKICLDYPVGGKVALRGDGLQLAMSDPSSHKLILINLDEAKTLTIPWDSKTEFDDFVYRPDNQQILLWGHVNEKEEKITRYVNLLWGYRSAYKQMKRLINGLSVKKIACVTLWNITTGELMQKFYSEEEIDKVVYRPDSQQLAALSYDMICLWDVNTGTKTHTLKRFINKVGNIMMDFVATQCYVISRMSHAAVMPNSISSVVYRSDNKELISRETDGTICFWNLTTGKNTHNFYNSVLDSYIETYLRSKLTLDMLPSNIWISKLAYRPLDEQLLSSTHDNVQLWNLKTGKKEYSLKGSLLDYSSDGLQIATMIADQKIILWNSKTGKCLQNLFFPTTIKFFVWNSNSQWLYTALNDGSLLGYRRSQEGRYELCWTTARAWPLALQEVVVEEAIGISEEHLTLLQHYEAKGTPASKDFPLPPDPTDEKSRDWALIQPRAYRKLAEPPRSQADNQFLISYDCWVISLMRKPCSSRPHHAFIVIEGIDCLGYGVIMRYDLFQYQESEKKHLAHVDPKVKFSVALEQLETVFYSDEFHIKDNRFEVSSWSIPREEVMHVYRALEADRDKDIPYNLLGDQSVIQGLSGLPGENCFTWARKKLLLTKNPNIRKGLESKSIDKIASHPKFYLKPSKETKEAKKSICRVM